MNKIIQGLWVYGQLQRIQTLCIHSFLSQGHEFHLYTYNKEINVPQGTIVKDASAIIPEKDILIDSYGSLASFSDWFRYNLLYEKGGWWVDMDMVCLKAFDFTADYVFSSEHGKNGVPILNIGAIKVPSHSDIMLYCIEEAQKVLQRDLPDIKWGTLGLSILHSFMQKQKKFQFHIQPPHVFCPIPYWLFEVLFSDIMISFTDETHGVHLWNEMLRQRNMDSISSFHQNSFVERSIKSNKLINSIHFMKKHANKYPQFPDQRESGATVTEQVQLVLIRILRIFDTICKKYDIDYWLDYGTLLGAVRHKGFIPWDQDIDIGILRADYELFIEKGVKDLPIDIFFQNRDTDPSITPYTPYVEARLRDKYSTLTFALKSGIYKQINWHNGINFDFFVYDWDAENGWVSNNWERIMSNASVHLKELEIESVTFMDFEGAQYPVPVGYDAYLQRCYGNYMELPPQEERIGSEVDPFSPCDHPASLHWKDHHLYE